MKNVLMVFLLAGVISSQLSDAAEQIRISEMGGLGDPDYAPEDVRIAYNSVDNEFLLVWESDHDGTQVDGEFEIFSRRLDGTTGLPLGPQVRLTYIGDAGDPESDASNPDVVYNPDLNEYLLVYTGGVDGEREIYSRRLDNTANPFGVTRILSEMGPVGDPQYSANSPRVVYNPNEREYMVVWTGSHHQNGLVRGEFEIFAQRVDAITGGLIGAGDIRVSYMGPNGDSSYDANSPDLAYDSWGNRYLVVWVANHHLDGQDINETEVFMQFLDGVDGQRLGDNYRISEAGGGIGIPSLHARMPAIEFAKERNEFMVIWRDDQTAGEGRSLVAQRINAEFGIEVGSNDAIVVPSGVAFDTDIEYSPMDNQYFVTATLNRAQDPDELTYEVFMTRVNPDATVAAAPIVVSDMRRDGNVGFSEAEYGAIAVNSVGFPLAAWAGDAEEAGMVEDEYEVYARLGPYRLFASNFDD